MNDSLVLVTGGTGFVGREVVLQLVDQGKKVRIVTRKPMRPPLPGVEVVQGNVHSAENLSKAFKGVSAVIHLVGVIFENQSTFQQAHVEVTRNVLAAARAAGVKRFVHMGSLGTRPGAASRYHLTKWESEELVRNSGLDWTIFRASLIYGYDEHDRIFKMISRLIMPPVSWVTFGSFAVFGGGKNKVQPVSVREVARCLTLAVETPASQGLVLDLAGPEPVTFRDLITRIAQAEGRPLRYEIFPVLTSIRAAFYLIALFLPLVVYITTWGAGNPHMMMAPPAGFTWNPSAEVKEILAGVWVVSVLIFFGWRELIIFSIPAFVPRLFCALVGLGEQFKMAEEDNIGDPKEASRLFSYEPEPLDKALRDYFS